MLCACAPLSIRPQSKQNDANGANGGMSKTQMKKLKKQQQQVGPRRDLRRSDAEAALLGRSVAE